MLCHPHFGPRFFQVLRCYCCKNHGSLQTCGDHQSAELAFVGSRPKLIANLQVKSDGLTVGQNHFYGNRISIQSIEVRAVKEADWPGSEHCTCPFTGSEAQAATG